MNSKADILIEVSDDYNRAAAHLDAAEVESELRANGERAMRREGNPRKTAVRMMALMVRSLELGDAKATRPTDRPTPPDDAASHKPRLVIVPSK